LRKELKQAEILAKQGNSVYLIPEQSSLGKKLLDAVVNGQLYEFKNVTGKAEKIERRFALAKEKGRDINVFISVELPVSRDEARRRIAQVLFRHPDYTGMVIVSIPSGEIDKTGEEAHNLHFWDSKEFRQE
jgi:D-serine deaminase-like pyridoxal phosphate-dependent protein